MAMVEEIMGTIAAQGNAVIVGRAPHSFCASATTLFAFSRTLSRREIRACWPWARVRKTRKTWSRTVDKERMAYIKHYFNADWPMRSLYH